MLKNLAEGMQFEQAFHSENWNLDGDFLADYGYPYSTDHERYT